MDITPQPPLDIHYEFNKISDFEGEIHAINEYDAAISQRMIFIERTLKLQLQGGEHT